MNQPYMDMLSRHLDHQGGLLRKPQCVMILSRCEKKKKRKRNINKMTSKQGCEIID